MKNSSPTPLALISVNETAKILGICDRTVATLIKTKAIAIVRIGRRTLVSPQAIEAFIASHTSNVK